MKRREWIPETTGNEVLLTGYNVGEKDTAVSEMTPDFGRAWKEPRKKRRVFLVYKKGKFNLEHFKFKHLRVSYAVRSMIKTCLVTMLKG